MKINEYNQMMAYLTKPEEKPVIPKSKPKKSTREAYKEYLEIRPFLDAESQMFIEKELGFADGGRINFSSGSPAIKLRENQKANEIARTDFKGKVHNTIQEAVDSNKKIMKELTPSVKETIVEKRIRKYGKTDKKPYIPAEKLEATIVEEFQKKFPDKKIKLSVKDASYSDGRKRIDSPEFKKFKEEFMSNRFVKGEEDILKAYASVRKKLGFKLKKQGPGPWQVLEELKKKGKGGVASRIKEILEANNLPIRAAPGNLKLAIKNSFEELVDAGTEIVDSKAVYDNLPAEFKGTKTSQPDVYKKRTQGELGLKGYIRSVLKDEEGFFETTRRNTPEAIAKRIASIKALGKGKAPTEYQLSKKAFFKDLDPLKIKKELKNIKPEKAAQLHHGLAKAYGEDAANLLFTSKALNDYDDAERSLFRLASEKDKLVREQPPGFEKRIKQIEAIENRIVKGKSIEGVKLPAVDDGPQNFKNSFTVNKGYAENIVQDVKGTPGDEVMQKQRGRKGLLGYREIDLEKVKDIDPTKPVVLGEGKMKGIDRSKTIAGLDKDPIFEKSFMDFDKKEIETLKVKLAALGCPTVTKATGGRIGFQTGATPTAQCIARGAEKINFGNIKPGSEARNATQFLKGAYKLGKNVIKFGVIPEAMFVTGESLLRMGLGDTKEEAFYRASEYLLPGNQTEKANILRDIRTLNPETASIIVGANDYKKALENLKNVRANTEIDIQQNDPDFTGITNERLRDIQENQIKQAEQNIRKKFQPEAVTDFATIKEAESQDIAKSQAFFPKFVQKARDSQIDSDIETIAAPERKQKEIAAPMLTIDDLAFSTGLDRDTLDTYRTLSPDINKAVLEELFSSGRANLANRERLFGANATFFGQPISPTPAYDFAGGGIAKLAGKSSGPPPKSGPTPQGLDFLLKRGR